MTRTPRLVVLRALNLGDVLTGIPALRALRHAFPEHHTTLVAPRTFASLVAREDLADAVSHSHELAPLDPALHGPDIAVDLHGRGPGSQPLLLALDPGRLVAFAHPDIPETAGQPAWRPDEHEVTRWCRLLAESGIPAPTDRLDIGLPPVPVAAEAVGATVVHPGAAAPSRRWPLERWAEVVAAEVGAGRRVVITGSDAEVPLAGRLAALAAVRALAAVPSPAAVPAVRAPAAVPAPVAVPAPAAPAALSGPASAGPVTVLAGRTSLDDLIAVVGAAGRVISADTGIAHVAFATGTASITLYGPVPPSEWGPPPGRARHQALWAGRMGDPHGSRIDPGLDALTVEDVLAAGRRLDAALAPHPHRRAARPGAPLEGAAR